MTPDERMRKALVEAQAILGKYIQPGKRDCESAVNELLKVLDDEELLAAINSAEMGEVQSA